MAYYIIGFTCPVIFPIHVISFVDIFEIRKSFHWSLNPHLAYHPCSRYRWTYIQFLNFYTHTEHHVSSTLPSRCASINVRRWGGQTGKEKYVKVHLKWL